MSRVHGRLVLLIAAILVIGAACASRTPLGGPRSQSDPITIAEIEERGPFNSLYDLVQILRPRWLRPQGPDTFVGRSGQVQVHIDGNWIGPVQNMRNLAAHGVTSLYWLDPVDAAGRFGLDHSHGAIIVSTAPVH
ncbi:MAG TPA: hypothetical protein VF167_00615 [Longimicrobiaceae bacterium]